MRSVTVVQPLNAIKVAPSAYNGENRFILVKAECMFFQRFLALVLCRPPLLFVAFVLAIVLIVWGEIGGGVCLPSSQLKQNFLPTIDFRTTVACENSAGGGFARRSVTTNFAETPYKNLIVISRAYPSGIGVVALDPSQWAMGFGSALNYYAFCSSLPITKKPVREGFEPSVAFWATAL
jgi:hypothetical protein